MGIGGIGAAGGGGAVILSSGSAFGNPLDTSVFHTVVSITETEQFHRLQERAAGVSVSTHTPGPRTSADVIDTGARSSTNVQRISRVSVAAPLLTRTAVRMRRSENSAANILVQAARSLKHTEHFLCV